MTKQDVQKRVLQNGEQLALNLFSWDEKTNTFSSDENNLVLDFTDIDYCTFDTGSNCTFKTGSYCTFKTGSNCTFKTGSNCTFKTGSNCTFKTGSNCVVVRRDVFEVIVLKENIRTILCPYNIKGYLEEIDDRMYLNGNKEDGEYIVVDNILSKIISRKKNVIKVINYNETEESYIVQIDDVFSHGKTIKEARDSIIYKMETRDLSEYNNLDLESVLSKEEAIIMYRSITGACAYGTKMFVDSRKIKEQYSIKEITELTVGQFGHDKLIQFFKLS